MICNRPELTGLFSVVLLVFSLCCHSAPDMPLLLVQIKYLPDLKIQCAVILFQPLGQVLMYRGFGNAEVFCGSTDSSAGFNHVHSHFTGPLLKFCCHGHSSKASVLTENPMPREMRICTLDSIGFWD